MVAKIAADLWSGEVISGDHVWLFHILAKIT